VLEECDGDADPTEITMLLKKQDPKFERKILVPVERPGLKLIDG